MKPGCTKSEAKIEKMRWISQSGYQMAPKTPVPGTNRRFLAIFGYPLGSQKSTKIDIFPKKPSQRARFHRFSLQMSLSSIFRLILSRFWMKNQWKKTCFFQAPLAVFPTWRPSRNTIFYNTKATFSFFAFLRFFLKKNVKKRAPKKNRDHIFPSKITQKSSPGTRFGTEICPELTSGRSKKQKMWEKSRFWTQ